MRRKVDFDSVGVIGLGLMGRGIASSLVAHGLRVMAYDRAASRAHKSISHIQRALDELIERRLMPRSGARGWKERFQVVPGIRDLATCRLVIESVNENLQLKRKLYDQLERVVPESTIIASNTSSLPITLLQAGRKHPGRFIGMHWGEPAHVMRYLEIIPGKQTSAEIVELTRGLGVRCGKEPTVLRKDIQGFISNRMMYAMIREACHLVEAGIADVETVDRSFRNDIGWWATVAGPFRWMDLTGIPAYATVMEGLLPKLSNARSVPKIMRDMVKKGGLGIANCKGFYPYNRASAKKWEQAWVNFTFDIRKLIESYEKKGLRL